MKHRSSVTGRAVSDKYAAKNKSTTVREGKAKDTLRLDWLIKNRVELFVDGNAWMIQIGDSEPFVDKSLRAAIDAAMKADA